MDAFTAFLWWFILPLAAFGTWWSLWQAVRPSKKGGGGKQ